MLRRILDDARRELVADVRRDLDDLRVSLIRGGATEEHQKALARSIATLDEMFLLVVVGEFNAGKSAVVNALLESTSSRRASPPPRRASTSSATARSATAPRAGAATRT